MTSGTATVRHERVIKDINLVVGGVLGLIAAIIMAFFAASIGGLLLISAISQLAVSTATAQSSSGLIVGLLIHLIFGIIFGVGFAFLYELITTEERLLSGLILGVLYGLALYVVNFLLLGRLVDVALLSVPALIAISSHIVYGLVLGLYPVIAKGQTEKN